MSTFFVSVFTRVTVKSHWKIWPGWAGAKTQQNKTKQARTHYSDVIMSAMVSQITSPYCLLNRLFRHSWRKTLKLSVTGLCAGNSPVTGEFPAQRASHEEKCFHLRTSSWGNNSWNVGNMMCQNESSPLRITCEMLISICPRAPPTALVVCAGNIL